MHIHIYMYREREIENERAGRYHGALELDLLVDKPHDPIDTTPQPLQGYLSQVPTAGPYLGPYGGHRAWGWFV